MLDIPTSICICNPLIIISTFLSDVASDVSEYSLFVHLAYQCSFLFVYFVGLYAGHTYIHLISFEIFLMVCLCTF